MTTNLDFGGAALIVPTFIGSKVKLLILLYSIDFLADFSEIWGEGLKWLCDQQFSF